MLKQSITYENLDGELVTKDFYFNMTKLEAIEHTLEYGDFEELGRRLTQTSNGPEAYQLFKKLLLSTVGVRRGDEFEKTDEFTRQFASSEACSELIFSFMNDPVKGALFFKEVMPKSISKKISDEEVAAQVQASLPAGSEQQETQRVKIPQKDLQNMTREELVEAMKAKMASE